MEPPLPPMHPKTPQLIEQLDLRVVDAVKWNLLLCVKKENAGNEPTHVLKFGTDKRKSDSIAYETRILREVLPQLNSSEFDRLVLPEVISSGESGPLRWVLTQYISGQPLIHQWSELNFKPNILGGRGIDEEVAAMSVDVLRDLRMVDIAILPDFVRRFSFSSWLNDFRHQSQQLIEMGLMEKSAVDAALSLFGDKNVERYEGSMFTNGDFYPRNIILLPDGKIAVVDWVGGIDPWEFVAMHAWLLMWGNAKWQARYMQEIKHHFPVDEQEMQVGLLVRSFDMVWRWKDEPEMNIGFARTQMLAYFQQCLDLDYVRQLFS
ncbi:MAG: hypothetical protein V1738_06710 [Patescibacteria group bacterium]